MINAKILFQTITKDLSDWLYFKRNQKGSVGGKVLTAISENLSSLQFDIDNYVNSHFLSYYLDKTYDIPFKHTRIHLGLIDLENIQLLDYHFTLTDNLSLFENSTKYAYFEDGFLYFKITSVPENTVIRYTYKNYPLEAKTESVMIWNVFDEFALYVGLKRYDDEDNEHLLNRILYQSQNPVNGSTEGLKNALSNALDLPKHDIRIEPVNSTNFLNEIDGVSLYETISELNRDIYRTKKWGIDYWQYNFKNDCYYPHLYDIQPSVFQDGIGDNDDLKIDTVKDSPLIHAKIKTYNKDEVVIKEYHKKYPSLIQLPLKLSKPLNVLKPLRASGIIHAGTLTPLSKYDFDLNYERLETVNKYFHTNALIDVSKCSKQAFYPFVDGKQYKLKVMSLEPLGSLAATATLNGEDLLISKDNFVKDAFGYLTHKSIKLTPTHLGYFNICDNFKHFEKGFGLNDAEKKGRLALSLNHLESSFFSFRVINPEYQQIESHSLSFKGFYRQGLIYENIINEESLFAIRQKANSIRFYIEGKATVIVKKIDTNDSQIEIEIENGYYETPYGIFSPIEYLIYIIPSSSTEKILIKELGFVSYALSVYTQLGNITNQKIPPDLNNTLFFELTTYTNNSPRIASIYFGEPVENLHYYTAPFTYHENDQLILEGMDVLFTLYDLESETETLCPNIFSTYTAMESFTVQLNLNSFSQINELYSDGGTLFKKNDHYYLTLLKGESINYFKIDGIKINMQKTYTLESLLDDYSQNATYFVSPIVDGIIQKTPTTLSIKRFHFENIYGMYTIKIKNPLFEHCFVLVNSEDHHTSCYAPLQNLKILAINRECYKSHVERFLYQEEILDVPFVDYFSPFLPQNTTLFFHAVSLDQNAQIRFYDTDTHHKSEYSIGIKNLAFNVSYLLSDYVDMEERDFILNVELQKHILLPDTLTDEFNNTLFLNEYIINTPKGYDVFYDRKGESILNDNPNMLKTERFVLEEDGFKKLKYCHVNKVIYISFTSYTENAPSTIHAYELIQSLGIIKFDLEFTKNNKGRLIYIHYLIDQPLYLVADTNILYDTVYVSEDAYLLTSESDYTTKEPFIQCAYNKFLEADHITVQLKEPGYKGIIEQENGRISIVKVLQTDQICIHDGYYYHDGKEYYMFADNRSLVNYSNDYIQTENVAFMHNGIQLFTSGINHILNSRFEKNNAQILSYTTSFNSFKSNNDLNRINSCEQINLWECYNTNISLSQGLYDLGIVFNAKVEGKPNMIAMRVPELLADECVFSFWYKGNGTPKIIKFLQNNESHIEISDYDSCNYFNKDGFIYSIPLTKQKNIFYYLVIDNAEGIIDDLVLCKKTCWNLDLHVKDSLKIMLPHFDGAPNSLQRFYFTSQKFYKGTTEMLDNGIIQKTSFIKYGYTPVLEKEWIKNTVGEHIAYSRNCIFATDRNAYCLSPIVKLDDLSFIEDIIIQTNFMLPKEKKCPFFVYMGQTPDTLQLYYSSTGDKLILSKKEQYVQVKVHVKDVLFSLDISARYKEGVKTFLSEAVGIFESEQFDLGIVREASLEQIGFSTFSPKNTYYVRSSKIDNLFMPYTKIIFDKDGVMTPINLGECRYIQFKIDIEDSCGIDYFEVKYS